MYSATKPRVLQGVSRAQDPARAAQELHEAIGQPDTALAFFFCAPEYDRDALARELRLRFKETPLIGCTTAGEITPVGYIDNSIVGAALSRNDFAASTVLIRDLDSFEVSRATDITQSLLAGFGEDPSDLNAQNTFGFLLVDGLSLREELLVSALHGSLGGIPLFGGSAGDGLNFARTHVYAGGAFHENCAVFSLIHTHHPFTVFKNQHFVNSETRMVVTGADVARRIVTEINGEPAALEYARMVGVDVADLNPMVFASRPVVVRIGGGYYVRAIQKANADGSLTFYCAIDEGIVLSLARGRDLRENVQQLLQGIRREIGDPQLIIGCDCILRKLEMQRSGTQSEIGRLLAENHVVGFSTYGEQFNGVHVNQTFTGVAIGRGEGDHA